MNVTDRLVRTGAYLAMPHFTVGVMGVIQDDAGRVLMVRSRIRQTGAWGFPGGFVRGRESPETALARELQEEVQISPLRHRLVDAYKQPWARHYDLVCDVQEFAMIGPGKPRWEVAEQSWFSIAETESLELTREAEYLMSRRELGMA